MASTDSIIPPAPNIRGFVTAALLAALSVASGLRASSDKAVDLGELRLAGFAGGCEVELDAAPVGKTSSPSDQVVVQAGPGDHYVHIECAGQPTQTFFVSLKVSEHIDLKPKPPVAETSPLQAAQDRLELTGLVQKAVQARSAGHTDEAIAELRRATELDPENPDLHQELGITFLLLKDWERARVEYLEAIKHDPTEGASHNGLGYALEKLGEILPAVNEFRMAVRLDPDDGTYQEHYIEALSFLEEQKERAKKKR